MPSTDAASSPNVPPVDDSTSPVAASGPNATVDRDTIVQQSSTPTASGEARPLTQQQRLKAGLEALLAEDFKVADQHARVLMKSAPDVPDHVFFKARVLAGRKRFSEAIKLLDGLAETHPPSRLPVLGQTAEWMVLQGQWEEAEDRYQTLRDAAPQVAIVPRKLAALFNREGRRQEAAELLRWLIRRGDFREAELRTMLLRAHPFKEDALTEDLAPIGPLGNARYELSQGKLSAAMEDLDAASADGDELVDALRGRLLAEMNDTDLLSNWADAERTPSADLPADASFARGIYLASRDKHVDAVRSLCDAVRSDPTDADAYFAMSASLRVLGQTEAADRAELRAQQIAKTHQIGAAMAASDQRNLSKLSELIQLLDELQRPYEALAWRAVQVAYGRSGMPAGQADQVMKAINQDREQRARSAAPNLDEFLCCGVDPEALDHQVAPSPKTGEGTNKETDEPPSSVEEE